MSDVRSYRGPMPQPSSPRPQRVHRALANPARVRLLEVLREEPDLDAATLAEQLGLHVTTVRTHLGSLEDADLVEAVVEDRDRPGRPRLLYRVVEDLDAQPPDDGGYRFLARVLASSFGAVADDPSAAAEQAGRAWGSFVADRPAPFQQPGVEEALGQLVAMLDRFGFAPELDRAEGDGPVIVLGRCPFLDVAREQPEVVCAVHLGLMRGVLEELGAEVEVRDLIPWARPDACVSHLTVPS